jgi:hypothetical protein
MFKPVEESLVCEFLLDLMGIYWEQLNSSSCSQATMRVSTWTKNGIAAPEGTGTHDFDTSRLTEICPTLSHSIYVRLLYYLYGLSNFIYDYQTYQCTMITAIRL